METATLIVMLALLEYCYFFARVGAARGKLGIKAPACTGDELFERRFRVQANTLEQMIIFIPATYAFAWYVSDAWVWLPGAMFILGRLLYSREYVTEPDSRAPGMALTFLANVTLVLGTLIALGIRLV